MTSVIPAFERSPDGGKGPARDTRVRWALAQAGQPYGGRGEARPAYQRAFAAQPAVNTR